MMMPLPIFHLHFFRLALMLFAAAKDIMPLRLMRYHSDIGCAFDDCD